MDKNEWEQQKNKSKETINNKKINPRKKYTEDDVRLIITNIDKYNNSISDCNKDIILNSVTLASSSFLVVFNTIIGLINEENRAYRLSLGAIFTISTIILIKAVKDSINNKKQKKEEYKNYLGSFNLELVEKPKQIIKRK